MPSFDVVSRVDFQEIDNAIANALREIQTGMILKAQILLLKEVKRLLRLLLKMI